MQTGHWTWTGDELLPHGGGEPIPIGKTAVREPTKMTWDWSTAGQDLPIDDPHRTAEPLHLPEREYTSRVKSPGAVTLAGGGCG